MENWISINDRLPENDDRVLVWENKTYQHVLPPEYGYCIWAYYDAGKWLDENMVEYNNNSDWTITHWMPEPPPPMP